MNQKCEEQDYKRLLEKAVEELREQGFCTNCTHLHKECFLADETMCGEPHLPYEKYADDDEWEEHCINWKWRGLE